MHNLRPAVLLAIALPAMAAMAADQSKQLPRSAASGYSALAGERQVTIVKRGGDTVEEYRAAGRLVMQKVTPSHGEPYYMVDEKGDGTLTRRPAQ